MHQIEILRADAEAEQLAELNRVKPNPWRGAGQRLKDFENASIVEKALADREAAAVEEASRAAAFAQAMANRQSLQSDVHAANVRGAVIFQEMHVPEMAEAHHVFDEYMRWRTNDLAAGEAEMVYRSLGSFPSHHYLYGVPPELIDRMRHYDALRKEHLREQVLAANAQDAINYIEASWPALKALPAVAVT